MNGEAYIVSESSCDSIESRVERAVETLSRGLLFVWVVLLIPWVVFAALSGIAFDTKSTLVAALIVVSIWSYAPAVLVAFTLLERSRKAVLLPLISIAGTVVLNLLDCCPHTWR